MAAQPVVDPIVLIALNDPNQWQALQENGLAQISTDNFGNQAITINGVLYPVDINGLDLISL